MTCMMIAIKFFDDGFYSNAFYAKVGGISVSELNEMEKEMTKIINFNFYIDQKEFERYCRKLVEYGEE